MVRQEGARPETCGVCLPALHTVAQAIDLSLQRLGVTYVDALLMHHAEEESAQSFAEQWSQMEQAVENGKARWLGLAAASDPLDWSKSTAPGSISPHGVFWRKIHPVIVHTDGNRRELPYRRELIGYWQKLGVTVFGGGLNRLTFTEDEPEDSDANLPAAAAIIQERRARGEEATQRQILLMFQSQTGLTGPGPVLPETRSLAHLQENLGVLKLAPLSVTEISRLSEGIHSVESEP